MKIIEVQITPNPNARKFVLSERICEDALSYFGPPGADGHPLAQALFRIKGVTGVLILGDFVTVNRSPDRPWPDLVADVKKAVAAFSK